LLRHRRVLKEGRLLDDDVGERAGEAERADAGATRPPGRRPVGQRPWYRGRDLLQIDTRIQLAEVQMRGDLAVPEGQDHLDQACESGGRLEMTEIGLDRSDPEG